MPTVLRAQGQRRLQWSNVIAEALRKVLDASIIFARDQRPGVLAPPEFPQGRRERQGQHAAGSCREGQRRPRKAHGTRPPSATGTARERSVLCHTKSLLENST